MCLSNRKAYHLNKYMHYMFQSTAFDCSFAHEQLIIVVVFRVTFWVNAALHNWENLKSKSNHMYISCYGLKDAGIQMTGSVDVKLQKTC